MSINPIGAIPNLNTLHNRLRTAREHAGLKQAELADKAGISRTTISAAETGVKRPAPATITVWAWACGVDVNWLKTGEEKTPPPEGGGVARLHRDSNPRPTDYNVADIDRHRRYQHAA